MSRFQHAHDNVLSIEERAKSARKCIALLNGDDAKDRKQWSRNDLEFFLKQERYAASSVYTPAATTLDWLRDLVGRYVT